MFGLVMKTSAPGCCRRPGDRRGFAGDGYTGTGAAADLGGTAWHTLSAGQVPCSEEADTACLRSCHGPACPAGWL